MSVRNKLTVKVLVGAIAAVVVVVPIIAWNNWRQPTGSVRANDRVEGASSLDEASALTDVLAKGRRSKRKHLEAVPIAEPPDSAPADEVVRRMSPLAEKGSPSAMRILSQALRDCALVLNKTDAQLELANLNTNLAISEAVQTAGATIATADGKQVDLSEAATSTTQAQIRTREACAAVGKNKADDWLDLLERSALAGDPEAIKRYAMQALDQYANKDDLLNNLDEVERRRDLSHDMLRDLLAEGDCDSRVLSGLQHSAPNPTVSYIYGVAQINAARADLPSSGPGAEAEREAFDRGIAQMAATVPSSQLSSANQAASKMYNSYCR